MTDGRAFHRTFLIAACLWLAGLRAYGQDPVPQTPHISIADHFVDGAKMVATFEGTALEGATAVRTWTLPAGMESESFDAGSRVYLWRGTSALGQHKIACDVTYTIEVLAPDPIDKTKFVTRKITLPAYHFEALFTVGSPTPGPEPTPFPPEPIPPKPGTLGALITDPVHRVQLATFYADMAAVVRSGAFASTGHFYAGQREAVKQAQSQGKLPIGLSAINKPVSDRITTALGGTADVPLDTAKQVALATALDSIAAEF